MWRAAQGEGGTLVEQHFWAISGPSPGLGASAGMFLLTMRPNQMQLPMPSQTCAAPTNRRRSTTAALAASASAWTCSCREAILTNQ